MTSYVYFMQPIGGGPIRIGFSQNPYGRLSHLTSYSPVKLEIITKFPASQYVESWLHDYFREDRLHGEWFTPSLRLFEIIESVKRTGWHPLLPSDDWPKYGSDRGKSGGKNFRRIREEVLGFSPEALADELKVSLGTVRHWEASVPSQNGVLKTIRLAKSLGKSVSFADFFGAERVEAR